MYTSTRALQTAFRREFKGILDFKPITDYCGQGVMYKTDTRIAFADWLNYLRDEGLVSARLAETAYLEPTHNRKGQLLN